MENQEKPIYRITCFFRRKPDMSESDFHHHWEKIHGPLCVPWALKHGILEYTQYHTPSSLRSLASQTMTSDFNTVMEYDGAADFYIADYGAYEAAYRDPYYVRVIEPDERNFVDKSETHVVKAQSTIGYNRSMILGGKANVEVGPQMRLWEEWEGRGKEEAEGGEEVKGGRKQ